jgi:hypothetical protein
MGGLRNFQYQSQLPEQVLQITVEKKIPYAEKSITKRVSVRAFRISKGFKEASYDFNSNFAITRPTKNLKTIGP